MGSKGDSSIALEGAALVGTCLTKALTTLQHSVDINQSDATMQPLFDSDVDRIKDAFGKAVLTSQKNDSNLPVDVNATLVGLCDHYNRVGQNWRLVGKKILVDERRKVEVAGSEVMYKLREGPVDRNGKFVLQEEAQILVYGDK